MDSLVTGEWLASAIGAADLRILDATYFPDLPGEAKRDAAAEYRAAHIPGALFLDLANLADKTSPLPATVPTPEQFTTHVGALGIGDGDRIVLYDDAPHHTAARAWWLFRYFGFERVAILDGGLARWRAEGRPLASGSETPLPRRLSATSQPGRIRTFAQMRANLDTHADQMLDARGASRFTGAEPDPRPNIAAGHIPGSRNLPYGRMMNPDGTWKDRAALQIEFVRAGIDLDRPMVATCGSGITAAVLVFGAHLLGKDAALYDGSWAEWGADPSTPKARGGG